MFIYLLLSIVSIYISLRTYILLCPKNSPNKYLFKKLKNRRNFIYTQHGNTSVLFKQSKSKSKKLVLTIHGFGSDLDDFKLLEDIAINNNYNYLSLDLAGRGLSDSFIKNNSDNFENQILEVLQIYKYKYKISEINVIGYSMGCIIVNNLIENHKINFNSVVLLSPAGLGVKHYSTDIFKIKYLGEILVILFGDIYLLLHNLKCYNLKRIIPKKFLLYSYNHYGYLKSLLSTIRNIDKDNVDYKSIDKPLVIYSRDDKVTIMNRKKFNLNCKFIEFKKLGHSELIENSLDYIFGYFISFSSKKL